MPETAFKMHTTHLMLNWSTLLFLVCLWAPFSLYCADLPKTKLGKLPVALIYSKAGSDNIIEKEFKRGAQVFLHLYPKTENAITVDFFDNKSTLNETHTILQKIKEKEYPVIVGIRNNDQAVLVSQFAEKNDTLFISPLATLTNVTIGNKNTFTLAPNEVLQGTVLARFASRDLSRKRILILNNHRSVFSQKIVESFTKSLKQSNDIELREHISNDKELNLEQLKKQMSNFKPDLVFISDELSNSAILSKYIYRLDPLIPFLAGSIFGQRETVKALFKEVPKIRVYYIDLWNENLSNPTNQIFVQGYQALWPNHPPTLEAAMTFDCLFMLKQMMDASGNSVDINRLRYFLEHKSFLTTQGTLNYSDSPTHSPVRTLWMRVTNVEMNKWIKGMRVKWKGLR